MPGKGNGGAWSKSDVSFRDYLVKIVMLLLVYVFAMLYLLAFDFSWRNAWVVFNLGFAYIIISDRKKRQYYGKFFRGFIEPRSWGYALVNIVLVVGAVYVFAFIMGIGSSGSGSGSGGGGSNPFVSSPLFLLFILPIVPLFADAETKLFQGLIIRRLLKKQLVVCTTCGKMALPMKKCDLCGGLTGISGERDIMQMPGAKAAVLLSAFVFALAHVILTLNPGALVLLIGGYLLGYLYVKEGADTVAKVHMLYDYILLVGIILLMIL